MMSNLQYQIYHEVSYFYGQWLDALARIYGHSSYRAVRVLEKKGLVVRVVDPENPKRVIIMTPEIKKLWDIGEE